MNFNISDKVVCIYGPWVEGGYVHPNGTPQKNHVYVVEGINEHPSITGLILVGVPCVYAATGLECGWGSNRFRKLSDIQEENRMRRERESLIEELKALGRVLEDQS